MQDIFQLRIFRQFFASLAASFIYLNLGVQLTLSSELVPQLQNETGALEISFEEGSWIGIKLSIPLASLPTFIGIPSLVIGGILSGYFGRRACVLILCIPIAIGWVLLATAKSYAVVLLSRIIAGFGTYGMVPISAIFIAEICEPRLRGSLAGLTSLMLSTGAFTTFLLGYLFSWRLQSWISLSTPILLFVSMFVVKETPYLLVEHGKTEEARKSLQWYRNSLDVDSELKEIVESKAKRNEAPSSRMELMRALVSKEAARGYRGPGLLQSLNQLSAILILAFYMRNIAQDAGSSVDSALFPVIVGAVRIVSGSLSAMAMKNGNRRLIFVICGTLITLSTLTIGLFAYFKDDLNAQSLETFGWIPLAGAVVMYFSYAFGIQPVINIISSEVYPAKYRTACFGFILALSNLCSSANGEVYPAMKSSIGVSGAFFVYACVSLMQTIHGFFIIPDNRGLSLVAIENKEKHDKY